MYRAFVKRGLDIVLSLLALLVLSVVLLTVAILVRIKLGRPVLFRQTRPGRNEKLFTLYKFRTMTDERDEEGRLLPDAMRLTRFGRLLRKTSLDELPELINILKGDMSLVGPRPLLVEYLPLYTPEQRHRHDVRPGLTGLAQVHGRNALTWEQKFAYDVEYTQTVGFFLDVRILWQTVITVVTHRGIHSGTSETMERFTGTVEEKEEQYV